MKRILAPLNRGQQNALIKIRSSCHPITFVQGPPGTGKTFFIEQVVKAVLYKGNNVLITTPSNAAADLIALRLAAAMPGEKIFRSYSLRDELTGLTKNESEPSGSDILEPADNSPLAVYTGFLRGLVRKNRLSPAIKLSIHIAITRILEDPTDPLAIEYESARKRPRFRLDSWFNRAVSRLLSDARVVIATVSNSTSQQLRTGFKPDLVILDEAGMAAESGTLVLMTNFSHCTKLFLLVGDPSQLPPFVASLKRTIDNMLANPFARKMPQSLMERMMLRDLDVPMLFEQRRAVAGLMKPASDIFYGGKLIDGPGTALEDRPIVQVARSFLQTYFMHVFGLPMAFLDIKGGQCVRDGAS